MSIKKLLLIGYMGWSGLGFIRGVNYYKFDKAKPYIYSYLCMNGLLGTFIYATPIFMPFCIHKEIYRLEINVRKLENEKKSRYYNDLI
jgi:hypothetical protein